MEHTQRNEKETGERDTGRRDARVLCRGHLQLLRGLFFGSLPERRNLGAIVFALAIFERLVFFMF